MLWEFEGFVRKAHASKMLSEEKLDFGGGICSVLCFEIIFYLVLVPRFGSNFDFRLLWNRGFVGSGVVLPAAWVRQ